MRQIPLKEYLLVLLLAIGFAITGFLLLDEGDGTGKLGERCFNGSCNPGLVCAHTGNSTRPPYQIYTCVKPPPGCKNEP